MSNLEVFITVVIGILLLLIVVLVVVMVKQEKETDDLVNKLANANTELDRYKIREETPLPMVKDISYLILKEEVERYKPPYKVGQKVMYNEEGFARVGYIDSVRTEQYMHNRTDKKEVIVKHSYEIGIKFYTDIIDVVKENENE